VEVIDRFESWWNAYPKKVSKKAAHKCWLKMSEADRDAAIAALPLHAEVWQDPQWDPQYTPYPATWLNGEKWNDDVDDLRRRIRKRQQPREAPGMSAVRRLMEETQNGP